MRVGGFSAVLVWAAAAASLAAPDLQAQQPVLSRDIAREVVDSLLARMRTYYVFPDSVAAIAEAIHRSQRGGRYDSSTARDLAGRLTVDLVSAAHDSHLGVVFDPAFEQRLRAQRASGEMPDDLPPTPPRIAADRRINNGFTRAEILEGNVGYLRLERWVDLHRSRSAALAALGFVANSDALIVDLRDNPGGYGNLRDFMASHFLPEGTPLLSERNSVIGRTTQVLAEGATLRLLQPLFLLVDRESASGSEGFSFILQQRKRAVVVGDTTAGGGTGNLEFPLGHGFVAYISIKYLFDEVSGRTYHGGGVVPDIRVAPERALVVAHHEAIQQLMSDADSADARYRWLLPWVKARAEEPDVWPDSVLRTLAGAYERVEIRFEDGTGLGFLGAEGIVRRLRPLERNLFVLEDPRFPELERIRVRFVFTSGRVTALELLTPNGNVYRRPRQ